MKPIIRYALTIFFLAISARHSFGQVSTNVPVPITLNNGTAAIVSRAPDSRGWTDPALNHNKLIQQQSSERGYKLIGTYKVIGSSFLFGEHHKGDMFAKEAKAWNIYLSYNTYNQEVEFYSTSNPNTALVKEPGTVDSFIIQQNIELGIMKPLKFIYGSVLGIKDQYYFQEVYTGKRFSLYKRYKSELGYSNTNLAQTELRQFDLQIEYYYTDTESKGIKKIKPNAASVIKEFKNIKDLSGVVNVDDFSINPEESLRKTFDYLNK